MSRLDRAALRRACDELARREPALAAALERHGYPPLWRRRGGFATLVTIILEQQVSLDSARALYRRLEQRLGTVDAPAVRALGEAGLRGLGLTRQKAAYCARLAARVEDGRTSFHRIARADDAAARSALLAIDGVGPWTADVYLLFVAGRPDIWPPGDVALIRSVEEVFGIDAGDGGLRMRDAACQALAERWRPWRSVAARLLWHAYLERRGRRVPPA